MTYLEFLSEWYNAVFVAAGIVGAGLLAWGRRRRRVVFRTAATLIVAALTGLTWNGAIHDLGKGSPAPRFPLVAVVAVAAGLVAARLLDRMRERYFRPIEEVRFNSPGLEGAQARIVSRSAGPRPGSGRAQWQDEKGVLHVVHAHTSGGEIGFGERVRLDAFDAASRSYLVVPVAPGGRPGPVLK